MRPTRVGISAQPLVSRYSRNCLVEDVPALGDALRDVLVIIELGVVELLVAVPRDLLLDLSDAHKKAAMPASIAEDVDVPQRRLM